MNAEGGPQAEAMDYADPVGTSRLVQALTAALDDAERFHPPEAALQTQQYLGAIRCGGRAPEQALRSLPKRLCVKSSLLMGSAVK